MHFADGAVPEDYLVYVRRKYFWIMGGLLLLFFYAYLLDLSRSGNNTPYEVLQTLTGTERLYKMGFNYLEHPPPSSSGCNSCRSRTFSCRGCNAVDPA